MNIKTANRLCELRKAHNLSQEELASKLNVSRQAISKWERSESSPDTDNLIELAKLYHISLDDLLNSEDSFDLIKENNESNPIKKESIILTDDENNQVIIGNHGHVILKDGNGDEISLKRYHKKIDVLSSISILLVVIAYLILGFTLPNGQGWTNWWFLFILIPVPESIYEAIVKKSLDKFNIPCLITASYCAIGMMYGLWHPFWILFLIIPVFYIFASLFNKKEKK